MENQDIQKKLQEICAMNFVDDEHKQALFWAIEALEDLPRFENLERILCPNCKFHHQGGGEDGVFCESEDEEDCAAALKNLLEK